MTNLMQYTVSPDEAGQRLDLFLTVKYPSLTRSQVQRLIEEALVKVNGKQALHAVILGFIHPETMKYMEFQAPVPKDFQKVLDAL